jgi:steroid delta-isomerase-like uncharacterized protein
MQHANKVLIHRWFEEVWNQGREETVDELMAPDAIAIGLGESDVETRGPAGFKQFLRNMRGSFSDLRIDVDDSIAEGDKVVVRVVLHGTHDGGGLGMAPTGRRVRVAGIVIAEIAGGQIVKAWNSWDQLGLIRQLGAPVVAPATPDRFLAAH